MALVFSALAKKDTMHIMAPLHGCPAIGPVIFTCIDGENRLAELADLWNNLGERPAAVRQAPAPRQTESVKEALQTAAEQDVDLIVGAGSLYLIGDIKALLQSEQSMFKFEDELEKFEKSLLAEDLEGGFSGNEVKDILEIAKALAREQRRAEKRKHEPVREKTENHSGAPVSQRARAARPAT